MSHKKAGGRSKATRERDNLGPVDESVRSFLQSKEGPAEPPSVDPDILRDFKRAAPYAVLAILGGVGYVALNWGPREPSAPLPYSTFSSPLMHAERAAEAIPNLASASTATAERLAWNVQADKDIAPDEKDVVRQGALKVLGDEQNCGKIVAGGRSTTRQGTFFVMCEPRNAGTVFNVWFTPAQAMGSTPLAVPTTYPEVPSREACEREIRARVTNPSSLDLHRVTGYATTVHNNGNRTVLQDFTATNALGQKAKYQARCLVLPTGTVETTITDAQ